MGPKSLLSPKEFVGFWGQLVLSKSPRGVNKKQKKLGEKTTTGRVGRGLGPTYTLPSGCATWPAQGSGVARRQP